MTVVAILFGFLDRGVRTFDLLIHVLEPELGRARQSVAALEKLVLDVEMLQQMMEFLTPIDLSEDALAFDAMSRVPTGGHFFGDEHTLARYETAFYSPMLSDWQNHGAWADSGALNATQRATKLWQEVLEDYTPPPMDDAIRDELDDFVTSRKEEIGGGEP